MATTFWDANSWTAFFQMLTPIALAVLAWINARGNKKAEKDRAEVKTTLAETSAATDTALQVITGKTRDIHTLVNSNMGELLRDRVVILKASVVMARRLAASPGATEEDRRQADVLEEAASEALRRSMEHDDRQAVTDRNRVE